MRIVFFGTELIFPVRVWLNVALERVESDTETEVIFAVMGYGRTVNGMDDYDYCEECSLYGDDYGYDQNGDLVSNCYDCPMNPDSDAWMR